MPIKILKFIVLMLDIVVFGIISVNVLFSLGSGIHSNVDLIRYVFLGLVAILLLALPILNFCKTKLRTSLSLLIIGIISAFIAWNPMISTFAIINFVLIGIIAYYSKGLSK